MMKGIVRGLIMDFISLFAGIGGFDLGFERAGMTCVAQVEINDWCQKILSKHWPDVPKFKDVHNVGKHNLPSADVIIGGFPCQPHSTAGKRLASKDERDLWGEYFRIICEINPRWVVAENVRGLLSSENGQYFRGILRDLSAAGYNAEWFTLRASDFAAPHKRERVFVIAYPNSNGLETNPHKNELRNASVYAECTRRSSKMGSERFWDSSRPIGARPMGMGDGVSSDVDRLRGLGNAVVPQVAQFLAENIMEVEINNFPS